MVFHAVCFVAVKPFFNKEPQDVVALLGKRVVFQCAVDGEPVPNVLWRREDGKMPIGRARILDDKSLLIENVQTSDEGIYICAAENLVGSITAKASLVVTCKSTFRVFFKLVTSRNENNDLSKGPNGIQMIIGGPFNRPKTMALVTLKSVILLKEMVSWRPPEIYTSCVVCILSRGCFFTCLDKIATVHNLSRT